MKNRSYWGNAKKNRGGGRVRSGRDGEVEVVGVGR